jgi:DNA-binding MarR family transcriptional regulator
MASPKRSDPGAEAWQAMWRFFLQNKSRMLAVAQEHELTPMQMHALRVLEPESPMPMRTLAERLMCDPSNVTGIVDRLTARGLIERRDAPHDRRAKLLAVTAEGERVRADVVRRLSQAPSGIAALSAADQRTLRDLITRALEAGEAERPLPAHPH